MHMTRLCTDEKTCFLCQQVQQFDERDDADDNFMGLWCTNQKESFGGPAWNTCFIVTETKHKF